MGDVPSILRYHLVCADLSYLTPVYRFTDHDYNIHRSDRLDFHAHWKQAEHYQDYLLVVVPAKHTVGKVQQ